MNDRTLNILLYYATPVTLLLGLLLMYLLIGDHPWFATMAISYTVLLAILYVIKLTVFKKFLLRTSDAKQDDNDG